MLDSPYLNRAEAEPNLKFHRDHLPSIYDIHNSSKKTPKAVLYDSVDGKTFLKLKSFHWILPTLRKNCLPTPPSLLAYPSSWIHLQSTESKPPHRLNVRITTLHLTSQLSSTNVVTSSTHVFPATPNLKSTQPKYGRQTRGVRKQSCAGVVSMY